MYFRLRVLLFAQLFALMTAPSYSAQLIRSIDQLVDAVRTRRCQNVEELLDILDPELRSQFHLVFDSRSAMEASMENPRVILSNKDASFVIAFAGSPQMKGGNQVEIMEFSKATRRFNFGRIEFSSSSGGEVAVAKNPQVCFSCHISGKMPKAEIGAEELAAAHPIWDTYPDWPGFYGTSHKFSFRKFYQGGSSLAPRQKRVSNGFSRFLKETVPQSLRYQKLVGIEEVSEGVLGNRNTVFGNGLLARNHEKLADILSDQPRIQKYLKSFQSALSPFASEDTFVATLDDDDRQAYGRGRDASRQKVKDMLAKYYESKARRFNDSGLPGLDSPVSPKDFEEIGPLDLFNKSLINFDAGRVNVIVRINFLLEALKVPLSYSNLTLEPLTNAISQGRVEYRNLGSALNEAIKAKMTLGSRCLEGVLKSMTPRKQ